MMIRLHVSVTTLKTQVSCVSHHDGPSHADGVPSQLHYLLSWRFEHYKPWIVRGPWPPHANVGQSSASHCCQHPAVELLKLDEVVSVLQSIFLVVQAPAMASCLWKAQRAQLYHGIACES